MDNVSLVIRIEKTIIGRIRGFLAEMFLTTAIWFAKRENLGFVQDPPSS